MRHGATRVAVNHYNMINATQSNKQTSPTIKQIMPLELKELALCKCMQASMLQHTQSTLESTRGAL